MPVTTIYNLRHALRLPYTLDPRTGIYTSTTPFPTGLPGDPPLSSRGVDQTHELAHHLTSLFTPLVSNDTLRVYSSCFYRCPQTLKSWITHIKTTKGLDVKVRGETGIGEWFGYSSRFTHPRPLAPVDLRRIYSFIDLEYHSINPQTGAREDLSPDPHGESIQALHDRVARNISHIIRQTEHEYKVAGRGDEDITLLLCFHAAPMIAAGRVLTGQKPSDWCEEDFHVYTAGLSKFERESASVARDSSSSPSLPSEWATNGGINGGFNCTLNSDTSFLEGGAERDWHFSGDESFDTDINEKGGSDVDLKTKDRDGFEDEEPAAAGEGEGAGEGGRGKL